MATVKMETGNVNDGLTEPKGTLADVAKRQAAQLTQTLPGLGTMASIRIEIDDALADMREFHRLEPDVVMHAVSAHSARLIEIAIQVQRVEVVRREWKQVRDEAEKVLAELKAQFQIASRLLAMRTQDWEMSGRGQV